MLYSLFVKIIISEKTVPLLPELSVEKITERITKSFIFCVKLIHFVCCLSFSRHLVSPFVLHESKSHGTDKKFTNLSLFNSSFFLSILLFCLLNLK